MELIKIYEGSTISARDLYQFLELDKSNWKRWYTKNILKNPYAIEGEDWKGFVMMTNGNETMDFSITLNFAKKLAMLSRSKKGEEAREYFLECEKTLSELKNDKRFEAFLKLRTTKEKLRKNIISIGGDDNDFLQIDLAGRKVLFNGQLIEDDVLNTLLLKGRDFATEATNARMKESELSLGEINNINEINHQDVRDIVINNTGKKPEELPREEKIKKLE